MPTIAGVDSCPGGWLAVLVTFYEEVVEEAVPSVEVEAGAGKKKILSQPVFIKVEKLITKTL